MTKPVPQTQLTLHVEIWLKKDSMFTHRPVVSLKSQGAHRLDRRGSFAEKAQAAHLYHGTRAARC